MQIETAPAALGRNGTFSSDGELIPYAAAPFPPPARARSRVLALPRSSAAPKSAVARPRPPRARPCRRDPSAAPGGRVPGHRAPGGQPRAAAPLPASSGRRGEAGAPRPPRAWRASSGCRGSGGWGLGAAWRARTTRCQRSSAGRASSCAVGQARESLCNPQCTTCFCLQFTEADRVSPHPWRRLATATPSAASTYGSCCLSPAIHCASPTSWPERLAPGRPASSPHPTRR